MRTATLSIREKVSYGLGDAGCNIVWQTAMLFLAYFYTDVYGLSPAHMGTMFLVVRFLDAITDPLMGSIVDRTNTKYGRYRPYILWFALPFGIACTLVFYTPDLSDTGKIIYAYASYIFLTLMYTALNVPYCALSNVMTESSNERTSLQSYRFALNTVSGLIVAFSALPLVKLIGDGNEQKGYLGAISVMSVLAVIMFLMCFRFTKERYQPAVSQQTFRFADLLSLCKSNQWVIIFSANLLSLIAILIKASSTLYYVNNVLKQPDLATSLMVTSMVCAIGGAVVCPLLFNRFEKSHAYIGILIATGLISISLYFVDPTNLTWVFIITGVYGFVQMTSSPLAWSMISDLSDYESHRLGKTIHGVIFATVLFAIKAGIALGGALVGWILASVDYTASATVQSAEVNNTINLLFTVIPGVLFILTAFIYLPYKLNKATLSAIYANKNN